MTGVDTFAVHCPGCRCDDAIPPRPATSSEWARRQALEAAAQAVYKARAKHATTTEETA